MSNDSTCYDSTEELPVFQIKIHERLDIPHKRRPMTVDLIDQNDKRIYHAVLGTPTPIAGSKVELFLCDGEDGEPGTLITKIYRKSPPEKSNHDMVMYTIEAEDTGRGSVKGKIRYMSRKVRGFTCFRFEEVLATLSVDENGNATEVVEGPLDDFCWALTGNTLEVPSSTAEFIGPEKTKNVWIMTQLDPPEHGEADVFEGVPYAQVDMRHDPYSDIGPMNACFRMLLGVTEDLFKPNKLLAQHFVAASGILVWMHLLNENWHQWRDLEYGGTVVRLGRPRADEVPPSLEPSSAPNSDMSE